jgi:hypothetical protein
MSKYFETTRKEESTSNLVAEGRIGTNEAFDVEEVVEEVEKPKEKEKIQFSLDFTDDEVVYYNQNGDLFFDPESFRELPTEVVDELTRENKGRYLSALGTFKFEESRGTEKPTIELSVDPRLAAASSRLEVSGKKPGIHYHWRRVDEQSQWRREGYKVTTDPDIMTFHKAEGNTHRVNYQGVDEMILTEIPEDLYKARQRAVSEKSRRIVEGAEATAAAEMRSAGGIPITPEQLNRANFTPSN